MEIVAAIIDGSIITNNHAEIIKAAKENRVNRFISKAEACFMAACDVGLNWERLAKSKVLCVLENGVVNWPE